MAEKVDLTKLNAAQKFELMARQPGPVTDGNISIIFYQGGKQPSLPIVDDLAKALGDKAAMFKTAFRLGPDSNLVTHGIRMNETTYNAYISAIKAERSSRVDTKHLKEELSENGKMLLSSGDVGDDPKYVLLHAYTEYTTTPSTGNKTFPKGGDLDAESVVNLIKNNGLAAITVRENTTAKSTLKETYVVIERAAYEQIMTDLGLKRTSSVDIDKAVEAAAGVADNLKSALAQGKALQEKGFGLPPEIKGAKELS